MRLVTARIRQLLQAIWKNGISANCLNYVTLWIFCFEQFCTIRLGCLLWTNDSIATRGKLGQKIVILSNPKHSHQSCRNYLNIFVNMKRSSCSDIVKRILKPILQIRLRAPAQLHFTTKGRRRLSDFDPHFVRLEYWTSSSTLFVMIHAMHKSVFRF